MDKSPNANFEYWPFIPQFFASAGYLGAEWVTFRIYFG